MDERVEERKEVSAKGGASEAKLRNMARAREIRLERLRKKRLATEFAAQDAEKLPGEGAVETLRRLVMILCSRFADGRMDKRTCLMCEMRVPPNGGPEYKNPCPCQDAWRYVDYVDRRDQEMKNAEG